MQRLMEYSPSLVILVASPTSCIIVITVAVIGIDARLGQRDALHSCEGGVADHTRTAQAHAQPLKWLAGAAGLVLRAKKRSKPRSGSRDFF